LQACIAFNEWPRRAIALHRTLLPLNVT
jgi:hypothetical protein